MSKEINTNVYGEEVLLSMDEDEMNLYTGGGKEGFRTATKKKGQDVEMRTAAKEFGEHYQSEAGKKTYVCVRARGLKNYVRDEWCYVCVYIYIYIGHKR